MTEALERVFVLSFHPNTDAIIQEVKSATQEAATDQSAREKQFVGL
jgi:hypothetical protein